MINFYKNFKIFRDNILYNNNLSSFLFLFLILTVSRIIPHEPNFTPILSVSILGFLFSKFFFEKLFLVIGSMLISDLIIGIHSLIPYVYLSIIIIILISNKKNYFYMVFFGPFIFFVISNFGEWLHSFYYTKDIKGLLECFYLAIPFFKSTLISTFFYCILIYFIHKIFLNYKAV
jgi:hypothetical protein